MSEDLPEDVLSDLHSKAIWGDDPISMPILGTIETVKSFSQKQLLEYLHSYYIPENCVLSIAGKISTNNIENLVNKYFGKWPYYKSKTITQYTYPKILKNHLFKQKDIEQLHINLGINGLEIGNDDIYSLLILNNMFGGGASSILFQKIREELGICYSIYSYISSFKNTGIISIYTSLNPRYSNQVIELIKKEIYKFSNLSITNDKLIKLKEQLKGSYILGLESTSSRMFSNGKSMLFFNKIDTPEDIIKKIDIITIENLNNVMEKTFKKGIQNSAFVGESVNLDSIINIIKG